MLQLIVDNKVIETNRICFSDGAVSYDLKDFPAIPKNVVIAVDSSYKISGLLDELSQLMSCQMDIDFDTVFTLNIPYLPYGRADRRFSVKGNSGLRNFMDKLSDLNIDRIFTVDPHNEKAFRASCSVLMEYEYITQLQAFREVVKREHLTPQAEWDIIIAPDKGAKEKAQTIADYYGLPLVCCTKERDVATGKLSNPVVNGDVSGKKLLIVDDLLDAGGTYIQLAQELYKQGAVFTDLYVTHLIAAKGLNVLTNSIRKLYTYHTCCGYVTMTDVQKFNRGEV
jgi:ribose-phosphate pyrophosphokinase